MRLPQLKLAIAGAALCVGFAWQAWACSEAYTTDLGRFVTRVGRLRETPDQLMESALGTAYPLFTALRRLVPEHRSFVLLQASEDQALRWSQSLLMSALWTRNVMMWYAGPQMLERSWPESQGGFFVLEASADAVLHPPWKMAYRDERFVVWQMPETRE
jgi:hypothetical protein